MYLIYFHYYKCVIFHINNLLQHHYHTKFIITKNIKNLNNEDLVTYFYNLISDANITYYSESMIDNMDIIKEDLLVLINVHVIKNLKNI